MLESTVTAKGQTSLPKDIRDLLGLRPGDRVRYLITGDEVRLVRPRKIMTLCGSLRHDGAASAGDAGRGAGATAPHKGGPAGP